MSSFIWNFLFIATYLYYNSLVLTCSFDRRNGFLWIRLVRSSELSNLRFYTLYVNRRKLTIASGIEIISLFRILLLEKIV